MASRDDGFPKDAKNAEIHYGELLIKFRTRMVPPKYMENDTGQVSSQSNNRLQLHFGVAKGGERGVDKGRS